MKKLSILLAIALVASVAVVASAQGPTKAQELQAAGITNWTPGMTRGQGPVISKLANPINIPATEAGGTQTIQYDSGTVAALPVGFGIIFGNNFNADNAGAALKATVTLNSFSFLFAEDSTADTGLFFQGAAPLNATSFSARVSVNVGGLVNAGSSFTNATAFNVIPQTALGTASNGMFSNSFFLGAWCLNANTTVPVDNEAIALDTNAFAGGNKGFTAASGTGPIAFAAQTFNAVLRANVTGIVPVELMAFDVE